MSSTTAEIESEDKSNKPSHIAFATRQSGEKTFWNACGVAWAHKDGKGFRIKLDAVPVSGIIELRVNEPKAANDKTTGINWDFSSYGEDQ